VFPLDKNCGNVLKYDGQIGGNMKKATTITTTVVAFILVGAMIIGWSIYQKKKDVAEPSQHVMTFSDDNFETDVVQASKTRPILVDFYAEWCFPCRMLDPVIEEVAKELQGRAIIGKLNTDKNLIARRFGITKIPAIFIIRDGEIKNAFYGVVPTETIVKALAEFGA
jgi:thioredoxin 1